MIRSDNEQAVQALVQAVALHREDETVIEGDSREVVTEHRVQRTRSLFRRRLGEGTLDRHGDGYMRCTRGYSGTVGGFSTRFCIGRDG